MIAPTPEMVQCERNIRALLALHGIPVGVLLERERDRMWCGEEVTDATAPRMAELAKAGKFTRSPVRLLKHHGTTALEGWREDAGPSLQVIRHSGGRWEFDIDKHTPRRDVVSIFGHLKEVIVNKWTGRKTDPFEIAKLLRSKRGIEVLGE